MALTVQDAPASPPPQDTLPSDTPPPSQGNAGRLVQLLVVLAAASRRVFILLGWGDLLLFIAILIVIVMLHELGHFATAKWAGMKVDRVLRRLRAAAVVGAQGRDRVRRQGHPRRRLRPHHRVHVDGGGRPRRTRPGRTATSRSPSGSSWRRPGRSCT